MSTPKFRLFVAWVSQQSDVRKVYVTIDGKATIAEIVAHAQSLDPPANPDELLLSGSYTWTRPNTAEEQAQRDKWRAEAAARHDEWERETYERLKAKFGGAA
jgi:hypothetical protein